MPKTYTAARYDVDTQNPTDEITLSSADLITTPTVILNKAQSTSRQNLTFKLPVRHIFTAKPLEINVKDKKDFQRLITNREQVEHMVSQGVLIDEHLRDWNPLSLITITPN